ncbi:phosphotyrosine-specific ptp2-like protein, variant 2 [Entomophthora muscae]|uniref:Phosphotyrosine-specific ptp2-like protein, variant 2 n=1 Tax=Entomophthora muscae TaxID=34485 RepID=A0ACC2SMQ8_9FUNG|nr:phosphotyrosine-specific ptp2-like protein, variant 2 [Entomophthora muscae]
MQLNFKAGENLLTSYLLMPIQVPYLIPHPFPISIVNLSLLLIQPLPGSKVRQFHYSFIYLILGGFKHFQTTFPDKVKTTKAPLLTSITNTNSLSSNLLGPLTCPVAGRGSLGRSTQFYDSLRQYNTATNTLAETIPIQMPAPSSNLMLGPSSSNLPLFLQKMLEENFGEKAMAEAFQKLDLQEQSRLREIATVNSEPMNRSRYCVSAGIEKGHKNRYVNIWPYEHTRIKLDEFTPGESDYINASLIHESITNNRYIATQGPLPSTFRDFWQLIWQCNSRLIVMLTKEEEGGRNRCHRYWPDSLGEVKDIDGKFEVKLLQKAVCSRTGLVTIRKFLLARADAPSSPRLVVQIQFSGWPDFGVPDEPTLLLRVRNLTRQFQAAFESRDSTTGPIAVHCSAGCGRTGAFCTIDSAISALDSGKASCYPDVVYSMVESFRDQRLSMVQTHRQLVLCYETLIWYLLSDRRCGGLSGLCPNLRRVNVGTPDPTTPFFDTESYFTPSPFPMGGDSYFNLPPSNHGAYSASGEGFPF